MAKNKKMILIDENDLKKLIKDAVNDAVDNITKKIASKCATLSYNNEIFSSRYDDDDECYGCSCGSSGGCSGSSSRSYSSYGFSCGSGPSTGGC